jgi:hypothetical protein
VTSDPRGGELRLTAVLQPRGPAAAVVLTDEQVAAVAGDRKSAAVKVTVNGGHTFDGRIARMGGENLVGFNRAVRTAAGVEAGDRIDVVIALDGGPRTVDVPEDLAAAMAAPGVADQFDKLAPSHRKEYVRWITEAKRTETRTKRIAEAVQKIGQAEPRR